MKGSDFVQSIKSLVRFPAREEAILHAADNGGSMRPLSFVEVEVEAKGHVAVYRVATDVLSIGEEDDFVRVPLSPLAAQAVADMYGFSLVTKRISDATWNTAKAKGGVVLEPRPMTPSAGFPYDASMMTVERFALHNSWIEQARAGRQGLVVGHKKDVVLTNRLLHQPTQVAIYGWHHQTTGVAIQPLSLVHESTYADYSHGIRFMESSAMVDGQLMALEAIVADDELASLLLDEDENGRPSPLVVFRQPGSFPGHAPVPIAGDTEPAPGFSISEAALSEALGDLDKGVHEVPPGSNSGPVIDAYLSAVGLHNAEWCAAAVTAWLHRAAARLGRPLPVAGSAGALALGEQLRTAPAGVRWLPRPTVADVRPGAVLVWRRPEAGPGKGHVGLVHSAGELHVFTVEGNVGDWVAMREHSLDDPNLVGAAILD